VKGSNDGRSWKTLDERRDEAFQWRSQTRAFKLARPDNHAYYRIDVTENGGLGTTTLAEIELLTDEKPSPPFVKVLSAVAGAGETVPVGVGDDPARALRGRRPRVSASRW
jgi:hypothetical protein